MMSTHAILVAPLIAFVFAIVAAPFFIQGYAGAPPLKAEQSFMKRQASGVRFDGKASDRTDAPGPDDGSEGLHGWGPIDTADRVYYRASDGLAAWHKRTRTWRVYNMSALAEAAGWYGPGQTSDPVSNDIYGLVGTRDRIWMGTNGIGNIMLDERRQRWSRFDVADRPAAGRNSFVRYADNTYVFAWGGGRTDPGRDDRADSSYPGLEVYSIRRDAWVRISAVPRVNVRSLATNHGIEGIAMGCSQVPYAQAAYVPLRECSTNHPDRVVATDGGAAYEFEREFPAPGVSGRFIITRDQLEAAFSSTAR